MKILTTILFLSYTFIGIAQETYYKEIQLEEGLHVSGFHMLTTEADLYIAGKSNCIDSLDNQYTCMSLSRHTLDGNIIWQTRLPWCDSANKSAISLLNDTLIVSSHSKDEQNRLFINFYSADGEYLKHEEINYDTLFETGGFFNNGQFLMDRHLYIQAEAGNLDGVTTTVTTKYNIDTGAHTHWDLHLNPIGTPVFAGFDFVMDIDSNFLAISELSRVNNESKDIKQITKFDKNGNIMATYFGPDYDMTSDVFPVLTVLQNGNYVFLHNIDVFIQNFVPQVVCLDPATEQIIWTYDYESTMDTLRLPQISQMITAKNGDIIGAGGDNQPYYHGGNSYYAFRMNPQGEMLWEHTFLRQDDSGKYISGAFRDVRELEDGSILGMGTDGNSHIALMRLSADGCLMDTNCDENIFMNGTTTIQTIDHTDFLMHPNPTSGLVKLSGLPSDSSYLTIYDINGRQVFTTETSHLELEVDLSFLDSGIYVLQLYDGEGLLIGVRKIVRE